MAKCETVLRDMPQSMTTSSANIQRNNRSIKSYKIKSNHQIKSHEIDFAELLGSVEKCLGLAGRLPQPELLGPELVVVAGVAQHSLASPQASAHVARFRRFGDVKHCHSWNELSRCGSKLIARKTKVYIQVEGHTKKNRFDPS